MIDLMAAIENTHPDKEPCKGKVYRGKANAFLNTKGEYVYQERMLPLKRQSCPGCERCGWMDEDIKEFMANGILPIINHIEDGATYKLSVVNESTDFESGYVDEYDFEFIKIKEEVDE